MGARLSRHHHQNKGPPCDQLDHESAASKDEEDKKIAPTSLIITICMLKMEPNIEMIVDQMTESSSSELEPPQNLSSPPPLQQQQQPPPQQQPKCRCFHRDNCHTLQFSNNLNNNNDNQNVITSTSTSSNCNISNNNNKLNNLNKLSNNHNSVSVNNNNLNIICDNKNNNNNTNLINQTIQQHQHQIQMQQQKQQQLQQQQQQQQHSVLLSNQNNHINMLNNNNSDNNQNKFNINVITDKLNDISIHNVNLNSSIANNDDDDYNNVNDCSVIQQLQKHQYQHQHQCLGNGGYDEKILNTAILNNDETSSSMPTTSVSANNCCRRKTLASLTSSKRSRGCKLCRSSSCSNSHGTSSTSSTNCKDKDGSGTPGKSKKGNWGLKFNCAKLRGSTKSSSSSSSTSNSSNVNLNIESEKMDSCICTAYRKVEDLELPSSSSASSTAASTSIVLPHLDNNVQIFPSATITTTSSNTSAFILPSTATTAVETTSLTSPTTTTTTTTLLNSNGQIIHRIERTTATAAVYSNAPNGNVIVFSVNPGVFDMSRFNSNSDEFSLEDCDERARIQREREIREGVDAPPNFTPRIAANAGTSQQTHQITPTHWHAVVCTPDSASLSLLQKRLGLLHTDDLPHRIHSQVDYIHCLVPDLQKITGCCFYWGKMDRYEAEKLLEGKPEGTFLLRDSAQEEFLFSVSFRKYNRSLHARIEQFNHKFSFDSRDPGVYTASTVTGLLEHYKDPSCVMFFEPMLTSPLNRNFCFSLQQLCRATIVSHTTYDGINDLCLPKTLKSYLKEYHYRQRVRVRPLDEHLYSNT